MSFKQAAPNAAGWQQSGQPAMPDPWQQGQPTQPDFQQHMRNPQAMDYFRTNQFAFERGMMGPPPLPQKHVPGYGIMGSPYPTPQPMGVRTAHPGPTNEGVVLPHSQNDQPLAYAKQPAPAINTGDSFNNFPQVNPMSNAMNVNSDKSASAMTKTAMPPAPNRISETRRDANVDIRGNDQRDLKSVMLADKRATLRATELLNANKRNAMNPNPTQRPFPELTENQTNTPRLPLSSMANTHRPTDIQSVLATYLSNNETSSDSVPSNDSNSPFTPAPQQPVTATPTSAADSGTGAPLPDLNRMFPSLPSSQRPSNSHDAAEDDKDKPKRRRRKRCGTCGPCQVKEDCGECYVCKNKGQVNAICKSRKCLLLRKKAGGSDGGSLTGEGPPNGRFTSAQDLNIPATHKPQSFDPSATPTPLTDRKAFLTQNLMFSSNSVGQPTVNPVSSSTAAPMPQQINNIQQNGLDAQMRTQANNTNDLSVFQRPQQAAAVRNEAPSSASPDERVKHSTNDHQTAAAYRKNGPSAWSGPGQGQRPALPWEIGMSKDAHRHRAVGGVGKGGKTLSGAHRPESNSKLNDLYSTFKDDMQRMNERTYFRANGVKVCKVLSKLLDLQITDEEFRSSQPPKPSANAWEQFLPDSKFMDGQPIGSAENEAPGSVDSQADGGDTRSGQEPVPREVVKYRLSDPETHNSANSHGTTSDVEADNMAEGAPNMDTQAVDSGFSSSSPADRQSPSPKARFGLQTSLSDSADTQRTGAEGQPFTYSPNNCSSTQPISATTQDQQSDTLSTSAAPSGGKSTGEDILDLSSNSASFPRMDAMHPQGPTSVTQSPVVPSAQTLQMFQQVAGGAAEGHQPVAESVNGILNALTAKITGSEQIKREEPTKMESAVMDPANLIKHNKVAEPANCGCVNRPYDENTEGPYYIHLGCANSIKNIRALIEERTGYVGDSIRIEKVRYTTKEGRTSLGCPAAKWILRRSSVDEKVLVVTKHRPGHYCNTAWLIIAIVVWEGVPSVAANHMYDYLTRTLPVYGYETERRCGTNQPRDCACQGWDMNRKGASFSFGCSWSVYYNGCKFARSHIPRKFKLRDESFEGVMESKFQALGQHLAPLYKQMAPLSYGAQVRYEAKAGDCRVGFRTGRPFSGCTATVDFCAHQHRDTHNMNNGCTVVVTLTKHRGLSKPEDEQLHALPMYCLEGTDEHGSAQVIQQRVEAGSIEILNAFTQEQRRRSKPYKKRKKGTETYQSPKVKLAMMESIRDKMIKDSKDPNKRQTTQMVPLPQDREMAKQDLFKCSEKPSPPSQPHNMSPTQRMAQFLAEKQLQQAGHTLPPPPVPQQGPAPPNPLVTQSLTPSAGAEGAQLKGMEDRVRQHIMHAQLQAQQMGQQPQSQSQPMDTLQSTREPVREDNSTVTPSDSLAEVDVNDEQLNPPKPRPPSPEYDDPEGKEVHEDNTHLFRDPDVGGVALALSHGAVLFEVAKRELHATTALRQPDRYNPTRISLVFYQHKRLNYKKHGFHEYQKAEEERQKARKAAKAAGVEYIPKGLKYKQKRMQEAALRKNRTTNSTEVPMTKFAGIRKKPGKKVGWKQKKQLRFAAYQYLWPRVVNHPGSLTTNSVVTNWVKGKCITTGPYQKWISLHTPPVSVQTPKLSNLTSTSLPTQMSIANLSTATTTSTVNSLVKTSTQAFNLATVHSSVITTDNSSINMPTAPQNVVKNNIDSSTRHLMGSNASSNLSIGANTPPQFPPSASNGPNLAAPNAAVNFNPPFSMVKNEANFARNPHIPEVVPFAQRPPTFYGT